MESNLQKLNDSNIAKFQLDSCSYKAINFLQFGHCQAKSKMDRVETFKLCHEAATLTKCQISR